ncbi:MAG TPA: hypothetical protein VGP05_24440, partial [Pseudonocardia sp.]|nr:hypothetical protein [Pseudonocardia sp.]
MLLLATIGSSVLIVRHSQRVDDYYYRAADPNSGAGDTTLTAGTSAGQTLPAAIASVDTLNAVRPSVASYGVAVLDRTTGQLTLGSEADIQRALSLSDDNAMNALWNQFGGSRTVIEMIGLANLREPWPAPSSPVPTASTRPSGCCAAPGRRPWRPRRAGCSTARSCTC